MARIVVIGKCVVCSEPLRGPKPEPGVQRVMMDCPKCSLKVRVELLHRSPGAFIVLPRVRVQRLHLRSSTTLR